MLAFLIILLWAVSGVLIHFFVNPEKHGIFGDMFGAVNALFSGLALAGVVVAIVLQGKELQLQREELKLTREELRTSAEATVESANALREQAEIARNTAQLEALRTIFDADSLMIQEQRDRWNSQSDTSKKFGLNRPKTQDYEERRDQCLARILNLLDLKSLSEGNNEDGEKDSESNGE